jgi:hypothetical protein
MIIIKATDNMTDILILKSNILIKRIKKKVANIPILTQLIFSGRIYRIASLISSPAKEVGNLIYMI